jgi:hypothetical protein
MSHDARFGTEVAFRLGAGRDDDARRVASLLAAAAAGCRRHVLFLNEAGEYGVLAEWDTRAEAEGFASRPATRRALADLARMLGREPSVRVYRMEETPIPGR